MLECRLPLGLKGDDDETNKDVDHEEGNDDDVDEIENGNIRTVVVFWANINLV